MLSGYHKKGTATSLYPSSHEQYPSHNVGQNELRYGVSIEYPNIGITIPFIVSNNS